MLRPLHVLRIAVLLMSPMFVDRADGADSRRAAVDYRRDIKPLLQQKCAACHGANGEGKPADSLVGGAGSLDRSAPKKSVGSFWPYATTLFDYVRRAMPHEQPQSLTAEQVYALTAFVLNRNGIVADDATLDAAALVSIQMPNRNGFFRGDDSPDLRVMRCMNDCKK